MDLRLQPDSLPAATRADPRGSHGDHAALHAEGILRRGRGGRISAGAPLLCLQLRLPQKQVLHARNTPAVRPRDSDRAIRRDGSAQPRRKTVLGTWDGRQQAFPLCL